MYDAMLQGLYILGNSAQREARAKLFLDYARIEQYQGIRRFDKNGTWMARKVSASTLRPQREPLIVAAFEAVKRNYLNAKGRVRDTWYKCSLRDIARDVGLESEYELLQRHLSSLVHSTPWAMGCPSAVDAQAGTWSWIFALRLAFRYAEFCQVPLRDEDRDLMRNNFENVFDMPCKQDETRS
jgi:hypothetical protein